MSGTVELMVDDALVLHRVIPMPPDGSCLFHSLGFSLFNSTDLQQAKRLRATIVEYICLNWEDLGVYTCSESGDPFGSEEDYRTSMLQSTTYGAVSELMAAGVLYPIKIEVYQDGVLCSSFGDVGNPTKRLFFSGSLSSGHYDVCVPVDQDVLNELYTPDTLEQNESLNLKENSLRRKGRPPKRKQGRPKTTEKSRQDQRREANQRYRKAHPEVVQNAVKRYVARNPEVYQKAVKRYVNKNPDLSNVVLLIIDEVSMISNVTLMFIHLRLTEIYDISDMDDGWFGRINIVLFGNLLQLPPVRQLSPFEDMKSSDVQKLLGSLSACFYQD